jgi:hypothetical protein
MVKMSLGWGSNPIAVASSRMMLDGFNGIALQILYQFYRIHDLSSSNQISI